MTLIKSISGIRGTIGGLPGDNLTPVDIVRFTSAFCRLLSAKGQPSIVVGRDARISGDMVNKLVCATLQSMGANVIDLGLSTTPTVEVAVPGLGADGGIILTASHNPAQWNALKLLNARGEFISAEDGTRLLKLAEQETVSFADVYALGSYRQDHSWIEKHISMILAKPLVDAQAIRQAGFVVAVDAVNSTGGIAVPALLRALGVSQVHELYCTPDGNFPHNPEPLPEHLTELSRLVVEKGADLGISVDPDVDRLALVDENGQMFGEEYTLVAVADYILKSQPGNTVSNLSSTRALADVTARYGGSYAASAVGEVNVVEMMKSTNAVIGGEGNGGVIWPALHYGRDALAGIALFLSHLAKSGLSVSELRKTYPAYFMSKNKIELQQGADVDAVLQKILQRFEGEKINTIDGVKIDFAEGWVHLRKSNTEPIIRIYSEGKSPESAQAYARLVLDAL
ncbi:MAG: phosphoglucosamine mutase [Bacteroidia bacterium]|jgi:phosphomannomutase|nr:phosphoglucosamine mutase [Bacteroidia bacterium]